ncbi:hypothetical protein [Pedobacter segetis]|nr:hypothetical protein [Pedobacter segetis]
MKKKPDQIAALFQSHPLFYPTAENGHPNIWLRWYWNHNHGKTIME